MKISKEDVSNLSKEELAAHLENEIEYSFDSKQTKKSVDNELLYNALDYIYKRVWEDLLPIEREAILANMSKMNSD